MMENHNRNVDPLTYRGRQGVHTRARSHRQYEASGLSAYMGFDMWWRWVSHHVPFPDDIWLTLPDGQRALLIIYGHPYPIIYEEIVDDGVDETINSVDYFLMMMMMMIIAVMTLNGRDVMVMTVLLQDFLLHNVIAKATF